MGTTKTKMVLLFGKRPPVVGGVGRIVHYIDLFGKESINIKHKKNYANSRGGNGIAKTPATRPPQPRSGCFLSKLHAGHGLGCLLAP